MYVLWQFSAMGSIINFANSLAQTLGSMRGKHSHSRVILISFTIIAVSDHPAPSDAGGAYTPLYVFT
jgi:hypothetical protein